MSDDDRLGRIRAKFAAISREYREQRGLNERELAEAQEAAATEQEQLAAKMSERVAQYEQEIAEQTSDTDTSGWPQRSEPAEDGDRFGFEEDEDFREQVATSTPAPHPEPAPEPTRRISSLPADDGDDFANVDWTSG